MMRKKCRGIWWLIRVLLIRINNFGQVRNQVGGKNLEGCRGDGRAIEVSKSSIWKLKKGVPWIYNYYHRGVISYSLCLLPCFAWLCDVYSVPHNGLTHFNSYNCTYVYILQFYLNSQCSFSVLLEWANATKMPDQHKYWKKGFFHPTKCLERVLKYSTLFQLF